MSAHTVKIELLRTGWKRWRASCSCGWRSRSNSGRDVAERCGIHHCQTVNTSAVHRQSWPDVPTMHD